jgi:hypothetical protein
MQVEKNDAIKISASIRRSQIFISGQLSLVPIGTARLS